MLRICAGKFKGKHLKLPPPTISRPSSNKLRQAIFNILGNLVSLHNLRVLDAFAGSGALGLEAISRGAAQVTFCENNPLARGVLEDNILSIGPSIINQVSCVPDIFGLLCNQPFNLIFLDPPYDKELEIKAIQYLDKQKLIAPEGFVIIEQRKGAKIPECAGFVTHPPRIYGQCQITFLCALK